MIEQKLKLVHLQLTYKCNLHCYFCGQWGEHGYLKNQKIIDLTFDDWKNIINQLIDINSDKTLPEIIIWGGEPFLYPDIKKILKYLFENNFKIAIVTNGVLIDKFINEINKYINTLYVSLDGYKDTHEQIRGVSNIFDKIIINVNSINNNKVKIVCLFTINKLNYNLILKFPNYLENNNFNKIVLQNLIFYTEKQRINYDKWLKKEFQITKTNSISWEIKKFDNYINDLPGIFNNLQKNIKANKYKIKVELFPFEINDKTIKNWYSEFDFTNYISGRKENYCYSPFNHIQIYANGDVNYCVDFNDFTAGNVISEKIETIINNKKSEKFKNEVFNNNNPSCIHCPWRYNTEFIIN